MGRILSRGRRKGPIPFGMQDAGPRLRARRHRAQSATRRRDLRARATIIFLRKPRLFSVQARNHLASALCCWKSRRRHARWIMPFRARALPARASPFFWRLVPLSSGDPVSPPQGPGFALPHGGKGIVNTAKTCGLGVSNVHLPEAEDVSCSVKEGPGWALRGQANKQRDTTMKTRHVTQLSDQVLYANAQSSRIVPRLSVTNNLS